MVTIQFKLAFTIIDILNPGYSLHLTERHKLYIFNIYSMIEGLETTLHETPKKL